MDDRGLIVVGGAAILAELAAARLPAEILDTSRVATDAIAAARRLATVDAVARSEAHEALERAAQLCRATYDLIHGLRLAIDAAGMPLGLDTHTVLDADEPALERAAAELELDASGLADAVPGADLAGYLIAGLEPAAAALEHYDQVAQAYWTLAVFFAGDLRLVGGILARLVTFLGAVAGLVARLPGVLIVGGAVAALVLLRGA